MNNDRAYAAMFFSVIGGLVTAVLAVFVGIGVLVGHFAITTKASTVTHTTTVAAGAPSQGALVAPKLVSIGGGLQGPVGTKASVYSDFLVNVSDLAYDGQGRVWASVTGDPGQTASTADGVYLLRPGQPPETVLTGSEVNSPVGLVWDHDTLIVSNYGYIEAWSGFNGTSFSTHKILFSGLAAGSSGWTDNGAVGPDGKVYLNVGAACDACQPTGKLEADVISFNPDGSDLHVVATRVRGNTFSEFMPGTDTLFGAMNQQNALIPAPDDQLGIITQGADWGFPTCYGQGGSACAGIAKAIAYLPPHNGTSSMALTDGQLGSAYGTSAFVASFTRGTVDRVALRKVGDAYEATGVYQFVSGLKLADGVLLMPKQHALLVSDRTTGTVYMVTVSPSVNPGASAVIPYQIPPTKAVPSKSSTMKTSTTGAGTANSAIDVGETIFKSTCGGCHTLAEAGTSGKVGPNLDQLKPSYATVQHQVTYGGGVMPAFGKSGTLSKSQVDAVAKYVSTIAGTK